MDIHQNCVIPNSRRARQRVPNGIGEIRGIADLPQLLTQRERGIEIVFTKQQTRRAGLRIAIDRESCDVVPAR